MPRRVAGELIPQGVTSVFRVPAQRDGPGTEDAMSTATDPASRRGTTARVGDFFDAEPKVGAETVAARHGTGTRRDPKGRCAKAITASCRSRSSESPDAARGSGRG
jgi:hypothetical protein